MLQINKIELKNFITYKDQVIDFNDLFKQDNILLIYGKNFDDLNFANDNGSGKSILYQAIVWTLTGKTTRNTNGDLLIGKFQKSMSCSITMMDTNKNELWIKRYRKDKSYGNGIRFKINGNEKSKGTQREATKSILDSLGLSYNRIINTSIFESDDERSRFIYLGDKDGKALLSQIKGLDIFQKCFEIAKTEYDEAFDEKKLIEEKIDVNNILLDKLQHELEENQKVEQNFEDTKSKMINDLSNKIKQSEKELAQKLKLSTNSYIKIKNQIEKLNKLIQNVPDRIPIENKKLEIINIIKITNDHIAVMQNGIMTNKNFIKAIENNETQIGHICELCGNTINKKALKKREDTLRNFVKTEKTNLLIALEHRTETDSKLRKINDESQNIFLIEQNNRDVQNKINIIKVKLNQELKARKEATEETIKYNKKLRQMLMLEKDRKNEFSIAVERLTQKTTGIKEQNAVCLKQLDRLKDKIKYRKAWVLGYGKEGIQIAALQSTVEELNSEIERISSILTDGSVEIKLVTEKLQRNKKVRNLFEFEISDINKKNLPFKEWSKGQKKRIEIIVSFALMNIEDNVISEVFLDELFDGIDHVGINKIKNLLEEESQNKGKHFIIFSHSHEIRNLFDNRAHVELKNGESKFIMG